MPRPSRSWGWILGTVPVVAVLVILGFRFSGIRRDVGRWQDYQKASQASGEDLGITAWLPTPAEESDDLMKHPWVEGFLASEAAPQARAVAAMQAWPALGLDGYEPPSEGTSWFDGKEAEAAKVLETGRRESKHLEAIHQALARSGCTMPFDPERPVETLAGSWTRLDAVSKALSLQAEAALTSGDGDAAVTPIESMLRLGNNLIEGNSLLSTVIGAGSEAQAVALIDLGLARHAFSSGARERLRAALPSRDIPAHMSRVMRVERGMFIKTISKFGATPPAGSEIEKSFLKFFYPPERLVATNSLFFCETLDLVLKAPTTRETWEEFPEIVRTQEKRSNPEGHKIAALGLSMVSGVAGGLTVQEEEIDRIRSQLAE